MTSYRHARQRSDGSLVTVQETATNLELAGGWGSEVGDRVSGLGYRWSGPVKDRSDVGGDCAPTGGVPTVCDLEQRIGPNVDESREALDAEVVDNGPGRIGERKEFLCQWAKKVAASVIIGGDQPANANIGRSEVFKETSGRVEDPGAFGRVRVEGHEEERVRGQPVPERESVALYRVKYHVIRCYGHGGKG